MSEKSRVVKSQYNLIFSLIYNIVVTILGFATRSVFVHSLGAEYLGLNGLFTNVLSLLSLAELGVGSAITFSLYKPIANKDSEKIKSLMYLYKKAYQIIGWIIFGLGIILTPFLKYIVNLDAGIGINYYVIYIMFLINTVISYWFFAYRSVIIYAHQDGYVLTKIETVFRLVCYLIQFGILLLLKNYYLYLALPIVAGIIKNIIVSNIAGKRYPIINEKNVKPLEKEEVRGIFQNVFALSIFKISGVIYGATDNIIISTWLGTAVVGIVSNFTMIIQLVTSYVNMVFQSMYASVGDLNASETDAYKYVVFKRLNLLNYWIYAYCTICLGCFLNPCIKVWLDENYCLNNSTVILLALVFLVPGLNNVVNIYKDACGLFKEVQVRAMFTAIINLAVSIVLVKIIGLNGVYIGTIVAYISTIYMVDCRVVFKKIFHLNVKLYYIDLLKKVMLFMMLFSSSVYVVNLIDINSWVKLFVCAVILSVLVNGVFMFIYKRTEEYTYLKSIVIGIIKKRKRTWR